MEGIMKNEHISYKSVKFFIVLIFLCASTQSYGMENTKKPSLLHKTWSGVKKAFNAPSNAFQWSVNKVLPNKPQALLPSMVYSAAKFIIPIITIYFSTEVGKGFSNLSGVAKESLTEHFPLLSLLSYHGSRVIKENPFFPAFYALNPFVDSPAFRGAKNIVIKSTKDIVSYIPYTKKFIKFPDDAFKNLTPAGLGVTGAATFWGYKNVSNPDDERGVKGFIIDLIGRLFGSAGMHLLKYKSVENKLMGIGTGVLSRYTAAQENMENLKKILSGVVEDPDVLKKLKGLIIDPETKAMLVDIMKNTVNPFYRAPQTPNIDVSTKLVKKIEGVGTQLNQPGQSLVPPNVSGIDVSGINAFFDDRKQELKPQPEPQKKSWYNLLPWHKPKAPQKNDLGEPTELERKALENKD